MAAADQVGHEARSSRSGATRRGRRRCRRRSTRRTGSGRASAGRSASSPPRRTPGAARRARRGRARPAGRAGRRRPVERGALPRAGRVLDLQVVAEEAVVPVERGHGEVVHREPHRPAPVGVAAEHRGRRLGGLVVDARVQAVELQHSRVGAMARRERPQPVRAEELGRVEQRGEHLLDAVDPDHAHEQPPAAPGPAQQPGVGQPRGLVQAVTAQEPAEPLGHRERAVQPLAVDDAARQHRDHRRDRPHLDRHRALGRAQPVVEHAVGVVPQADAVQRVADGGEVLEERLHQVHRGPVAAAVQDRGDRGHHGRVARHPAGAVGLLEPSGDGQVRAVDRADVVQAHEPALEQVRALGVLAVDPPGEVDQQLVEHAGQEVQVVPAVEDEHLQRGPGVHRRVDVAEVPLVGGQRPAGVLEPLPAQQRELVLRERGVDVRERDAVERQVPGGEPGVLPGVGHGEHVVGVEGAPTGVAAAVALLRRRGLGRVAVEPGGDVVVVELLAPQHPGERLAHHQRLVRGRRVGRQVGVERVGLGAAGGDHVVEVRPAAGGEPQPQLHGLAAAPPSTGTTPRTCCRAPRG